jgi:hypothetical protein
MNSTKGQSGELPKWVYALAVMVIIILLIVTGWAQKALGYLFNKIVGSFFS